MEIPLTPLRQAVIQLLENLVQSIPQRFGLSHLPPATLRKLFRDSINQMPEPMLVEGVQVLGKIVRELENLIPEKGNLRLES